MQHAIEKSTPRNICLLLALAVTGCKASADLKLWQEELSGTSIVFQGFVVDAEDGTPLGSAAVQISDGPGTTTGPDGMFQATLAPGRLRVTITSNGHLPASRDVMVGTRPVAVAFRLVKKGTSVDVGPEGGSVASRSAQVVVPMGAFPTRAMVTVTVIEPAHASAMPVPTQFVDNAVPRRAAATVSFESSVEPMMPVAARVPVPAGVQVEDVAVYTVPANGVPTRAPVVESVAGGMATFRVDKSGVYVVAVDTRKAGAPGYVVVDPGSGGALSEGQVIPSGTVVTGGQRATAVVDPYGNRVEVVGGGRVSLDAPIAASATAASNAGSVTVLAGLTQVVLAEVGGALATVVVQGRSGRYSANSGAFSVLTCDGGPDLDRVEVVAGKVHAEAKSGPRDVAADVAVTFCDSCADTTAAPRCSISDAAAMPDSGSDAGVDVGAVDAPATDAIDGASVSLDGPRPDAQSPANAAGDRCLSSPKNDCFAQLAGTWNCTSNVAFLIEDNGHLRVPGSIPTAGCMDCSGAWEALADDGSVANVAGKFSASGSRASRSWNYCLGGSLAACRQSRGTPASDTCTRQVVPLAGRWTGSWAWTDTPGTLNSNIDMTIAVSGSTVTAPSVFVGMPATLTGTVADSTLTLRIDYTGRTDYDTCTATVTGIAMSGTCTWNPSGRKYSFTAMRALTSINFDQLPGGGMVPAVLTNEYPGVTFSSTSGGPAISSGEASSAPNFLIGNPSSLEPIIMDLSTPAMEVKVTLISVGDATVTATAYDKASTIVDTTSVSNPGTGNGLNNHNPIRLASPSGIARVRFEITKPGGGDGFGIDDVTF
jgi:hypothetical protein